MRTTGADLLAHLSVIRREAARIVGDKAFTRLGEISSYDPNRIMAKCLVYPEMHESGWLRIGTKFVGDGFGMIVGPTIGDLVEIHFADGDYNAGVIGDSIFTNAMPPPGPVYSGEVLILHSSGTSFKLPNSGNMEINVAADLDLTITGNISATVNGQTTVTCPTISIDASTDVTITSPTVTVDGNLEVSGAITFGTGSGGAMTGTGDINLTGSIATTADVVAGTISLQNHLTTGVTPGSGESGKPTG